MTDKESLLGQAISMLMKVYAMHNASIPLTEKQLEDIESIVDTYMEIIKND